LLLASSSRSRFLILSVLGSIVFGLATALEAAAVAHSAGPCLLRSTLHQLLAQAPAGDRSGVWWKTNKELGRIIKRIVVPHRQTAPWCAGCSSARHLWPRSRCSGGQEVVEKWVLRST